ncbi:hypothetical protein FRB96_003067 [Tulasnella sp. 330]|nr:hypothetical protein FRB96_003067 [Tulasnella sp. 330]KAG8876262.1 hypothetical protein FRB97_004304 [Tulasnella sp. 331]KAG8880733.1 hypothetical protein FRB98_004750 [Tulasnella sp. 332]
MWPQLVISLASFISVTNAHGSEPGPREGETMKQYAFRHMVNEHHIDAFDVDSFFSLHDLNSDGIWSVDEIEAIYGVHHPYSKAKTPDKQVHDSKAQAIVAEILRIMDKNGDGVVTAAEFREVGLEGLPDFSAQGAEGHHYDVESEFYLHHEEVYHNTPETQTDEAYNHPEDIEHFEHHEKIELEEENKEREYQGLDPLEKLPEDHDQTPPAPSGEAAPKTPLEELADVIAAAADPNHITPMDGAGHVVPESELDMPNPRYTRSPRPTGDANFQAAEEEAKSKPGYGEGPAGYKPPKGAGDKLRRNMPYKYKFRRNWGDF